jgi:hypothetical protein
MAVKVVPQQRGLSFKGLTRFLYVYNIYSYKDIQGIEYIINTRNYRRIPLEVAKVFITKKTNLYKKNVPFVLITNMNNSSNMKKIKFCLDILGARRRCFIK